MKNIKNLTNTNIVTGVIGILGLIGLLLFGLPSPDDRPKIYELYLAGVWFLITLSIFPTFFSWSKNHWSRKIMAIAAPLAVILYLVKYFN